jgi:hypothetical protein
MNSPAPISTADSTAPAAIVRYQSAMAFVLLLMLSGIFAVVDLGARSRHVAHWFNEHNLAVDRKHHKHFVRSDQFFDDIDFLWMKKLQQADYSKGGVEIFGSSVAMDSLRDSALPADQAALIHNFGYSGTNLTDTAHFIRFLIDHKGLLQAGPDKSLIILGLTYGDLVNSYETRNYFKESVLRSGLYDYDSVSGITIVPLNPFQRRVKFEEMRCRSFLMALDALLQSPASREDPKQFGKINVLRMGTNWHFLLPKQVAAEGQLLCDLRKMGVHVVGVLLPVGSWNDGIPAHDQFMPQMRRLFADESVPLVDCSRLLPDSGYDDSLHCSMASEPIIHRVLMKMALDFLHGTGALGPGSMYVPL